MEEGISEKEIETLCEKLRTEGAASGYFLNPDEAFVKELVRGLIVNQKRYGYPSCPCRLASGVAREDTDIVCPCDYRDPDVAEHGACFCALYVSREAAKGERRIESVCERRPVPGRRDCKSPEPSGATPALSHPVWRCRVCGYLCARDEPPEVCPICKVKKDRFEKFM
jgi:ferredoxin-thioredoxin reductase catalytic chain